MKVNPGFFISKLFRLLNRPALRDCSIDNTSKVGSGSNCINVTMGRYSYMGKNNSMTNVEIGSFCSIASYCSVGGGAHDIKAVSTSPIFHEGKNVFKKNLGNINTKLNEKVIIGNDVWIGENVFITDGVVIGDGAVVGAHSVVLQNVPPFSIVAGVPAKIIRYRFEEHEIHELLKKQWWDLSESDLIDCSSTFGSIKQFLYDGKEIKK